MNKRQEMVDVIRDEYKLNAPRVLFVMLQVPRERFIAKRFADIAYEDQPIPIGHGQTISQPYTVAFMTHLLDLFGDERVLEIGTGSGYQAAILSKLAKEVYTIEIVNNLAKKAKMRLDELGCKNVFVKTGKGERGWRRHAPYDAIIITAGVDKEVPKELMEQLKVGGRLIAPLGRGSKRMTKFDKLSENKFKKKEYGVYHFVPFVKG